MPYLHSVFNSFTFSANKRVNLSMKNLFLCVLATSLTAAQLLTSADAFAQRRQRGTEASEQAKEAPKPTGERPSGADEPKSIAELTKKSKAMQGLFTLYQDTSNGSLMMLIRKEQIGKEFIYCAQSVDGLPSIGLNRGSYRSNKIFTIERYFNKISLVIPNDNFYFDPNNALSKAAEANTSKAILFTASIAGQNAEKDAFLIKVDDLFMSENLQAIKPNLPPNAPPTLVNPLGNLNKEKSRYDAIKNYPANTNVTVQYVYDNPSPRGGGKELADPRAVSIKMLHTFLEVPENDFQPRRDDARIGYFGKGTDDMTSLSATPYRDHINRWHLKKKNPGATISEPVEPITWWMENTTPKELRPIIKKAGEKWNIAFEKAGFRNAVVVKEQPDTASWDAGDIRYNVLRWTSSANPPFGGYGPSFTNPRTGQIIGADIMLEWVFLSRRIPLAKALSSAVSTEEIIHNVGDYLHEHQACHAGALMQYNNLAGGALLEAMSSSEVERTQLVEDAVHYLVLHEMGHTFGLMHNMRASTLHPIKDLHNKALTDKVGLYGSVMDYPAINLSSDPAKQGNFYITTPGPYDLWAIEYGYSEALADPTAETKRLNDIANRSSQPELVFGNDGDDMRSPGKGIDPRVMLFDLSSDAITFGAERIQLINKLLPNLRKKYTKTGESYQELLSAYAALMSDVGNAANAMSRFVGGVYVDRTLPGQPGGSATPFTPVALADQKRAMAALSQHIFGPSAFQGGRDLYRFLAKQRRFFNQMEGGSEDPKVLARFAAIQSGVLDHLLHPNTLDRIVNSEQYGNSYKLGTMMTDLTNAIMKGDPATGTNSTRQTLQADYVGRLITAAGIGEKRPFNPFIYQAQAQAYYQLTEIRKFLALPSAPNADVETKAHKANLLYRINNAMASK